MSNKLGVVTPEDGGFKGFYSRVFLVVTEEYNNLGFLF